MSSRKPDGDRGRHHQDSRLRAGEGSAHRVHDSGEILGTVRFMSPERFGSAAVDHRCDIWAMGVVLYNMITARLHDCADTLGLMDRIKYADPAPFAAPPDLRNIILKALSKRPSARHQTMAELVGELRALQLRLPGLPEFRTTGANVEPRPGDATDGHSDPPGRHARVE